MSVQSRREPSKLFTATIYGFTWAALLTLMISCVWGTVTEIRTQAIGATQCLYIVWYVLPFFFPAVIALCRMGFIKASKLLYLTVQSVYFTLLLLAFWVVLSLTRGDGFAFFLGNPEPGVVSSYEAFFIWALFIFGVILQIMSVMNDKYRNEIRIGVGGILFIISIFLPSMLNSYALLRATCTSPLLQNADIKKKCLELEIAMPLMFRMAIAFSAALAVLFFVSMFSPTIERFIGSLTDDGAGSRTAGSLPDSQESAEPERNLSKQGSETAVQPAYAEPLPSAVRRNNHFGNFTAAVLGGVVVWAIQAIGERAAKRR